MRFQTLAGALALAGYSTALSDSTPWVMLSTSTFPNAPSSEQMQTSSQAIQFTKNVLSSCPTDRFLIASQPGVNAADLRGPEGCTVPHLCRAVEDSRLQGKYVLSEIIGDVSKAELSDYIRSACLKEGKEVHVDEISMPPLTSNKASSLVENDVTLGEHLDILMMSDSYTILYIGTKGETIHEAEFGEPVRMDLKRYVHSNVVRQQDNETEFNKLPLFEKYQFFTPGIFMGIIVAIVLLSILGVGLRALASLEVSYGAFDKDMGPAAQKKQQ